MTIFHKILPNQAHGKPLRPPPRQASVQPRVRRNLSTPEAIHKIGGSIPRDSMREVEVRSKLGTVNRSVSLRVKHRSSVAARRIQVHVNLLEGVSGAPRPAGGCLQSTALSSPWASPGIRFS